MPVAVQQRKATVDKPRPCLLVVTKAPAAIPAIEAVRTNTGREELISGSANTTCCGPKDNQFFRTYDMEPAETVIGLGVRERQERRYLLRRCPVDLEMISDSLRACHVIVK